MNVFKYFSSMGNRANIWMATLLRTAMLKNYSLRLEDTEEGLMIILRLNSLPGRVGPPSKYIYQGDVFLQVSESYPVASPPYEKALKLQPRYSLRNVWKKTQKAVIIEGPPPASFTEIPLPSSDWYEITVFDVPARVLSKPNASAEIIMYVGSTDSRRISQGYRISRTYIETFRVSLEPDAGWTREEAQVMTATSVSGFGD